MLGHDATVYRLVPMICRQRQTLILCSLHRQINAQSFSTTFRRPSDRYNTFTESLRRGGLIGEALTNSESQRQKMREMQQRDQKAQILQQTPRRYDKVDNSPQLRQGVMQTRRSAEKGMANRPSSADAFGELHHLHVYATKHNTHIALTRPNREPLLSLSTGNINFSKGHRGGFDAAYQLVTYTIAQMIEKGFVQQVKQLEVVMRGYGPGREAFQKVLLGSEGGLIKPLVSRVTDGTRLKFGGTRSPKVRRL